MTEREQIKWPYGFEDSPRHFHRPGPPAITATNQTMINLVAGLSSASDAERREFLTWLHQMLDYHGVDSITAIEHGIDPEPVPTEDT